MFFDPRYFLFVGPAILLALWAQAKVKHNFSKYGKITTSSRVSGAEAARMMLMAAGLTNVSIERVRGFLSDHYDPRHKVLRLSPDVHDGRSLSAVGVACHEAGHAIQDARAYAPLVIRNAIVPMAGFGSNLGLILVIVGLIINATGLAYVGLALFSLVVLFQIINLPVEFDASSRAKQMLPQLGIISGRAEEKGVSDVLGAAAMTYVAATITAIMTLLYYAFLVMGRRN